MSEHNLTDLLERAGEHTPVGPPPVDRIEAGARRTRRRRFVTATVGVAVGAAVVAAVGGAALSSRDDAPADRVTTSIHSPGPTATTGAGTDLEGTWSVHALIGPHGQSVLPAAARDDMTLTFKDGRLTGDTGCNSLTGRYVQSGIGGRDLVVRRRSLTTTLVGCSDEPPLASRLLDVRHVSGSGDVRYLHAANWMIVVALRRD